MTTPARSQELHRVICDQCGARALLHEGEQQVCPDCGGPYRPMAFLEGLVDRWFAPDDHRVSEMYPRHLKLVELMWTSQGRGREMFEALALEKVSYSQFVKRGTELVARGLSEGWIAAEIPAGPTHDDTLYRITFVDPDRWAEELERAFDRNASAAAPRLSSGQYVEPAESDSL